MAKRINIPAMRFKYADFLSSRLMLELYPAYQGIYLADNLHRTTRVEKYRFGDSAHLDLIA